MLYVEIAIFGGILVTTHLWAYFHGRATAFQEAGEMIDPTLEKVRELCRQAKQQEN